MAIIRGYLKVKKNVFGDYFECNNLFFDNAESGNMVLDTDTGCLSPYVEEKKLGDGLVRQTDEYAILVAEQTELMNWKIYQVLRKSDETIWVIDDEYITDYNTSVRKIKAFIISDGELYVSDGSNIETVRPQTKLSELKKP